MVKGNKLSKKTRRSSNNRKKPLRRKPSAADPISRIHTKHRKYRDIIEKHNDGIILLQDKRVEYANKRIFDLTGYTEKEVIHRPFTEFLAPEYRDSVMMNYARLASGQLLRSRNRIEVVTKDGAYVPVEINASGVTTGGKRSVAVIFSLITAHKQSPKNIRQVFADMRCLVWHAIVTKIGGRFFWNMTISNEDACHGFLPLKMRQDQSYSDAFRISQFPEDKKKTDRISREALSRGRPGYVREFRCVNAKNEIVWLSEDVHIKKLGPGKWRLIGVCIDVTERKRTEQALLDSELRYKKLVELSPDAIAVHSGGKIVFVNSAALKLVGGAKPEDLVGKPVLSIVHPDSRAVVIERIKTMSSEDKQMPLIEEKFMKLDGTPIDVEVAAMPMTYEGMPAIQVVIRDITERKLADKKLKSANQQLIDIIEFLPDPVFVINSEKQVIAWNRAMEALTGVQKEAMLGKGDYEYAVPLYGRRQPILIDLLLSNDRLVESEYEYIESKGDTYYAEAFIPKLNGGKGLYVWTKASPLYDKDGSIVGAIESLRDITDRRQFEEKIKYLSFHDKLTDLYNRAFFEEELKRLDSDREVPISFIIGDLNNLKMTNDIFGHSVGDKLIMQVAKIMKESCRSGDIICRWGGDEFLILLPRTDTPTALRIIERIKKACEAVESLPVKPYVALGVATKDSKAKDIINVLKEAEDMMYRDKTIEDKSSRGDFISAIQKTLWERSDETKMHADNIRAIITAIGKEMSLTDAQMKELTLLALHHDIGNVAVPEGILAKPGPLTAEEWNTMSKHPEIGYRITQSDRRLKTISDAILSHHERWDGTGYPQGLKGEKIPLQARILSIVDAYDVMTSGRIYKAACPQADALKEINDKAGKQFDPSLVQIFMKVIQKMH